MYKYAVVVGNVGIVYTGNDGGEVQRIFSDYVGRSKHGKGRAAGESVTMLKNNQFEKGYIPGGRSGVSKKSPVEEDLLDLRAAFREESGRTLFVLHEIRRGVGDLVAGVGALVDGMNAKRSEVTSTPVKAKPIFNGVEIGDEAFFEDTYEGQEGNIRFVENTARYGEVSVIYTPKGIELWIDATMFWASWQDGNELSRPVKPVEPGA